MFGNILPEILMSLMVTTRIKKSTVKVVLKAYLRKTRDFDGIYRSYLAVLEGKSLNHSTNRKDHGVKQFERVKAIKMLNEVLGLDGGKVLVEGVKNNNIDTGFYQVRQILETILSFNKSKHINLSVKDATRKVLVKLIQTYDLSMLKKYLGSNELEALEEIENKYVQKKYDSKFAKKIKS